MTPCPERLLHRFVCPTHAPNACEHSHASTRIRAAKSGSNPHACWRRSSRVVTRRRPRHGLSRRRSGRDRVHRRQPERGRERTCPPFPELASTISASGQISGQISSSTQFSRHARIGLNPQLTLHVASGSDLLHPFQAMVARCLFNDFTLLSGSSTNAA